MEPNISRTPHVFCYQHANARASLREKTTLALSCVLFVLLICFGISTISYADDASATSPRTTAPANASSSQDPSTASNDTDLITEVTNSTEQSSSTQLDQESEPLTDEELTILAQMPTLRVGIYPDREPMSYLDNDGNLAGVTYDVMERIAQDTGLTFEYVVLDSTCTLTEQFEALDLDIVAGCEAMSVENEIISYATTHSFCSTRAMVIFNAALDYDDLRSDLTMAVTIDRAAAYKARGYNVLACPTVRDCLQAVNDGNAMYTYENSYVVTRALEANTYDNTKMVDATVQRVDYSLILAPDSNPLLLSALNKTIDGIYVGSVIGMVYNHTYATRTLSLHEMFAQHPLLFTFLFTLPLLIIIIALTFYAHARTKAANQDSLTHLLNAPTLRRKFASHMRKSKEPITCLLIIDLDNFKSINDRFGHFEGDRVLQESALLLREACTPKELAARMGGDEFLLLWNSTKISDIERRAKDLLERFAAHITCDGTLNGEPLSASIGITRCHADEPYDEVYRRADKMLYKAKDEGKGAVAADFA